MNFEGDDFESREFRRGIWHQTTTTVALLTAAAADRENVMACEWAMMVSTSPLCFVISVHPTHATHGLIEESGEFGLNFCSDAQAKLSHVSGSFSQHEVDKWTLADFATYPAHTIAAPMIADSLLNVECRVIGKQELGHTLFVGKVVWARYEQGKSPLIYHDAKYWHLGSPVAKD